MSFYGRTMTDFCYIDLGGKGKECGLSLEGFNK